MAKGMSGKYFLKCLRANGSCCSHVVVTDFCCKKWRSVGGTKSTNENSVAWGNSAIICSKTRSEPAYLSSQSQTIATRQSEIFKLNPYALNPYALTGTMIKRSVCVRVSAYVSVYDSSYVSPATVNNTYCTFHIQILIIPENNLYFYYSVAP